MLKILQFTSVETSYILDKANFMYAQKTAADGPPGYSRSGGRDRFLEKYKCKPQSQYLKFYPPIVESPTQEVSAPSSIKERLCFLIAEMNLSVQPLAIRVQKFRQPPSLSFDPFISKSSEDNNKGSHQCYVSQRTISVTYLLVFNNLGPNTFSFQFLNLLFDIFYLLHSDESCFPSTQLRPHIQNVL